MNNFRVPHPEEQPILRQLWKDAFGDSEEYLDVFFRTAFSPERCRVLDLDTIAAAAYWLNCETRNLRLAYVYAVAVQNDRQNQGLGSALMKELHRHLESFGYDGILLVPGSEGLRKYYGKLGYQTISYQNRFTAAAEGYVEMKRLDTQTYAALRRNYLPENGICQEGENLALLAEMVDFFQGPEFLAAVAPGEGICLELLGSSSAAPAITATLGLARCAFRTPGSSQPYAMALSFGKELPENLYFGFGFD